MWYKSWHSLQNWIGWANISTDCLYLSNWIYAHGSIHLLTCSTFMCLRIPVILAALHFLQCSHLFFLLTQWWNVLSRTLSLPAERREGELCLFAASLLLLCCVVGYFVVLHNIVYRAHSKTQHRCSADCVRREWNSLQWTTLSLLSWEILCDTGQPLLLILYKVQRFLIPLVPRGTRGKYVKTGRCNMFWSSS